MTADVVVIGGGLSGLAAAVRLALDGAHVVLVEQRGKLGGRTYSYLDQTTGDIVENGQHVLVGAYRQTLKYLDLIGTRDLLHSVHRLRLTFHHPKKGFSGFELAALPQPLNIAAGMMKFKLLSFNDRQKMLHVGLQLKSWNGQLESRLAKMNVEEWLDDLGQSEEAKRCFWHPIAISMMNELPNRASALLFARSIKNTFLGKRSDATMLIPTVGQTELYVDGAARLLQRRKAKTLLDSEVESIVIEKDVAAAVKLRNGKLLSAGAVIAAVPHYALGRLLPAKLRRISPFAHISSLPSSPIVSVHLWFDRPIVDDLYVGLIDRHLQWVFNRRRITGEKGKPENYISAVISAAHQYVGMKKHDLVRLSVADLKTAFPAAKSATLLHSVVIKEKRATLSPTNDAECHRPRHVTPVRNFFLAGDWTDTGLPPTIEGAVMSGFACATAARSGI